MKLAKHRLLDLVSLIEPGSDDVTYTHAVFAQCFMPLRRLLNSAKRYEVRHGHAALLITAGDLLNPQTQEFVQMDVPSGSAARIALAHINNHIIRSRSLDESLMVPMGDSLRATDDARLGAVRRSDPRALRTTDMRALVGLYENTRAMDIYTWLAYRLPRGEGEDGGCRPLQSTTLSTSSVRA